ncbi:MAG: methyltransferase domain-containing protein [Candidatus Rokubacteria bacterium]|nr:methyltransferase domain-containing protein [Candidatus Rokubacteria bacterium]
MKTPTRRGWLVGGIRWGLDRMLSVGYGVVYDFIFERFAPYLSLRREVLALVETSVPESVDRRDVHVLDVGCGPGNFAVSLAEAGFSVVGIDPYAALVELAREKRRAKHLPNLAFRHADLTIGNTFRDGAFDQVVNIHSLYLNPTPDRLLRETYRVLKPGGSAVFVNFTRRVWLRATFRAVRARAGLSAALRCLLWLLPNSIFEATRTQIGPHYWEEDEFSRRLRDAGFTVLEMRRTFLDGASLLAWARKDSDEPRRFGAGSFIACASDEARPEQMRQRRGPNRREVRRFVGSGSQCVELHVIFGT